MFEGGEPNCYSTGNSEVSLASFTEKGPALLGFAIFLLAAVTSSGEISLCVGMAAESGAWLLRLVTFGHIGADCRLISLHNRGTVARYTVTGGLRGCISGRGSSVMGSRGDKLHPS